jgi:hypothetical protein
MKDLARMLVLVACLVCLSALLAPTANADEVDQKTTITFSKPVELPGISLPAGTYVFKMLDYVSDQDLVEVLSQDEQHVLGIFRTIPDYRLNNTTDTSIIFEERASNAPSAIKEWFFPDKHYGHEFVYPEAEAHELARTEQPEQSAEPPVMKSEPATAVENFEQTAPTEQTPPAPEAQLPPQPLMEPEAQQPPQTAEMQQPQQQSMPQELPKTASFLPLTGLIGMLLVAGAVGLRLYSEKIG